MFRAAALASATLLFLPQLVAGNRADDDFETISTIVLESNDTRDDAHGELELGLPQLEVCHEDQVAETCAQISGKADASSMSAAWVQQMFSASDTSVRALWAELGLPVASGGLAGSVESCLAVCEAIRDNLMKRGMCPPSSNVGCRKMSNNEQICDVDLTPEPQAKQDLPNYHDDAAMEERKRDLSEKFIERAEESAIEYRPNELIMRVANLFRIFPRPPTVVMVENSPSESKDGTGLVQISSSPQRESTNILAQIAGSECKVECLSPLKGDRWDSIPGFTVVVDSTREFCKGCTFCRNRPRCLCSCAKNDCPTLQKPNKDCEDCDFCPSRYAPCAHDCYKLTDCPHKACKGCRGIKKHVCFKFDASKVPAPGNSGGASNSNSGGNTGTSTGTTSGDSSNVVNEAPVDCAQCTWSYNKRTKTCQNTGGPDFCMANCECPISAPAEPVPTSPKWLAAVQEVSLKAQSYLSTAISKFNTGQTDKHFKTWFGNPSARMKSHVQKSINSVDHMIANVEYKFPGPECEPNVYAYVYPGGPKAMENGRYVFYLCELYMRSELSVQVETLTHEGSHHATAYLDDVQFRGETAYGRDVCKRLAKENPQSAIKNADNFCYYIQDITDLPNMRTTGSHRRAKMRWS